jgi:hypothetical protein
MQGPDTDAQDQPPPFTQIRLATHGRSIQLGSIASFFVDRLLPPWKRTEGRRHSYGMERFLRRNVSFHRKNPEDGFMNGIIYLVGLIVVIGVILSFFGLR